jgi:uncharacterized protein
VIRVLALLLLAVCAWAQVAVPPLKGRVTDLTGTLTREQVAALEQMLQSFEARKGSQIAVLMLPSTAPETIEQYALRVAEAWKIGRRNVDDGAVVVVAKDDRAARIEVGYGLEGALNDATASRIGREVMVPRFREGDGEPLPPPKAAPQVHPDVFQNLPLLLIVAFVAGAILRRIFGRFLGALAAGGAVAGLAWLLVGVAAVAVIAGILGFFFTLVGGGGAGRRYYGGFPGGFGGRRGGGWGGGGFGGGGFRGGGGSFGGGGASVRW